MEKRLKTILSNVLGIGEEEIKDSSSVENITSWDSLNHINLIVALEENYGLSFSEEEMLEMTTFGRIKRILSGKGINTG